MPIFRQKPKKPANTPQPSTERLLEETHADPPDELPLSPEEARKLKRLQRDGLVILIDQANLETGMRKRMKKYKKHASWSVSYGQLVDIIARRGHLSHDRRRVVDAYIVTSKKFQNKQGYRPSRQYLERNKITLERSPDERTKMTKEKSVDCMLVRIMTQAFEGIELLRLKGIRPPERTFCLVAGDYDYADVVQKARESGCDVEIWYWLRRKEMSKQWGKNQAHECRSERCGRLVTKDLEPFLKAVTRWRRKDARVDDVWSAHRAYEAW